MTSPEKYRAVPDWSVDGQEHFFLQQEKTKTRLGSGRHTCTHSQVLPDGKVLRFDVTQVQLVGEVVVKVPHHVEKTQCNAMHHLPGGPRGPVSARSSAPRSAPRSALPPRPGHRHLLQGEDVLVPGVSGRQVLHGVEVAAGAQHLGHVGAEILQDSGDGGSRAAEAFGFVE